MFSFANPQYLYLLLLLPVIVGLFLLARLSRQRNLRRFGQSDVVATLTPDVSPYKPWIILALHLLVIAVVVVILARPRAGATTQTTEHIHGIEVVVAMDVSNSMRASSTDNPQDISRLQRAKLIVQKLIDRLQGNKVALVVFAGNAYMQMPMTNDASSAKLFLSGISTKMVPTQGTAIGAAISMGVQTFSQSKKSQKAIIVITDGENFEDDANSIAHQAHKNGIQVDVMGVGSSHGAPIPMDGGNYLTDEQGQVVTTFLNSDMAQQIAHSGGGVYVDGNAPDAVQTLYDTLDKLAKTDLATVNYSQRDELFPAFAWLALLLIVASLLVLERKNPWLQQYNFFTKDNRKA